MCQGCAKNLWQILGWSGTGHWNPDNHDLIDDVWDTKENSYVGEI